MTRLLSRLAANHVDAWSLLEHIRDTTDGCLRVFLNLRLSLLCSVPVTEEETTVLHSLLELIIVLTLIDMSVAEVLGLLEDISLNVVEKVLDVLYDASKLRLSFSSVSRRITSMVLSLSHDHP